MVSAKSLCLLLTLPFVSSEWPDCHNSTCHPPDCLCANQKPPNGLEYRKIPQFVMLTFDSAITIDNMPFYQELILKSGRKNKNGCSISATFFVSHEYTDYRLVHRLYMRGNEIAVHSISHTPDVERWKNLTYNEWRAEISGMKAALSRFAKIPLEDISGVRAPFLQTSGDVFYKMLKDEGFLYDSSAPTLLRATPPLWPYTLDNGFQQDCQIQPCPTVPYKGLWMVPIVNWFGLEQRDKETGKIFEQNCAMVDGCTPETRTIDDTLEYLKKNFYRHYHSTSKAPFPIFLREGWLRNRNRKEAFLTFIDELLERDDVYLVSIKDVIDYLRKPVEKDEYKQQCRQLRSKCPSPGFECKYSVSDEEGGERRMGSCVTCPPKYPKPGNPTGQANNLI